MDDGDAPSRVGMRVDVGRLSVGCPAGVPDAGVPVRLAFSFHFCGQIGQSALGLGDLDPSVFKHGDTSGVIAAVFQLCQRRYQHVRTVARSYITYYSTHDDYSFKLFILL